MRLTAIFSRASSSPAHPRDLSPQPDWYYPPYRRHCPSRTQRLRYAARTNAASLAAAAVDRYRNLRAAVTDSLDNFVCCGPVSLDVEDDNHASTPASTSPQTVTASAPVAASPWAYPFPPSSSRQPDASVTINADTHPGSENGPTEPNVQPHHLAQLLEDGLVAGTLDCDDDSDCDDDVDSDSNECESDDEVRDGADQSEYEREDEYQDQVQGERSHDCHDSDPRHGREFTCECDCESTCESDCDCYPLSHSDAESDDIQSDAAGEHTSTVLADSISILDMAATIDINMDIDAHVATEDSLTSSGHDDESKRDDTSVIRSSVDDHATESTDGDSAIRIFELDDSVVFTTALGLTLAVPTWTSTSLSIPMPLVDQEQDEDHDPTTLEDATIANVEVIDRLEEHAPILADDADEIPTQARPELLRVEEHTATRQHPSGNEDTFVPPRPAIEHANEDATPVATAAPPRESRLRPPRIFPTKRARPDAIVVTSLFQLPHHRQTTATTAVDHTDSSSPTSTTTNSSSSTRSSSSATSSSSSSRNTTNTSVTTAATATATATARSTNAKAWRNLHARLATVKPRVSSHRDRSNTSTTTHGYCYIHSHSHSHSRLRQPTDISDWLAHRQLELRHRIDHVHARVYSYETDPRFIATRQANVAARTQRERHAATHPRWR